MDTDHVVRAVATRLLAAVDLADSRRGPPDLSHALHIADELSFPLKFEGAWLAHCTSPGETTVDRGEALRTWLEHVNDRLHVTPATMIVAFILLRRAATEVSSTGDDGGGEQEQILSAAVCTRTVRLVWLACISLALKLTCGDYHVSNQDMSVDLVLGAAVKRSPSHVHMQLGELLAIAELTYQLSQVELAVLTMLGYRLHIDLEELNGTEQSLLFVAPKIASASHPPHLSVGMDLVFFFSGLPMARVA